MGIVEPQPDWWVISDTHWRHRNINKYAWRTTPMFPTPRAVDQLMYSNWRALVKPEDTILHLGDLCFWNQGEPIPEMRELPGRKLLIKGNHDNYRDSWYADHGFEVVAQQREDIRFRWNDPNGMVDVIMSHYPIHPLLEGAVNVHGHRHNNPGLSTPSHINVSVELTHFAPVRLSKVLEKVCWHHFNGAHER